MMVSLVILIGNSLNYQSREMGNDYIVRNIGNLSILENEILEYWNIGRMGAK